jgi:hydrogenase maturation factor
MDKVKLKQIALSAISANALPVVSLKATKENPAKQDWLIRDTGYEFEKIANEIAQKILDIYNPG